ncbi:DUF1062 domain-containing protein [Sulfitobacter sp. MF3-043]|uniref:DUF1062 domain-containing protein n=1 Tax=Sulfitobacter sediminivivens TaxID=3252902 RepID=UPI0036DD2CD8
MTEIIMAEWTIVPKATPKPIRHCSTCAKQQPFVSSGKIRLNANGKKLDAWLIYKCQVCDQTWNRPILDRHPVSRIKPAELDAMQHSLPSFVARYEFDVSELKRQSSQIDLGSEYSIEKSAFRTHGPNWSEIRLCLRTNVPTRVRVDRLLCEGWQLSRSQLKSLVDQDGVTIQPNTRRELKKSLNSAVSIIVYARVLPEGTRNKLKQLSGSCAE